MEKPSSSSSAIFLVLNLLCFALTLTLANGCNTCIPQPKPTPTPKASCPRDALKLGVCATLLNGPVNVVVGSPPVAPCCSLLDGLVDLEVAACLCTAIKANILGINLNIPVSLSLLLNICGKDNVPDFQCA